MFVRLTRLEWLPRQAKLPLHGGWRRNWQMCHWPWDVKSTIRKAKLPQHKPLIALGKGVATYNFETAPFCNVQSLFRTILNSAIWSLSQSCKKSWHLLWIFLGTLLLQLQQCKSCEWQDDGGSQDKQSCHCMVAGFELDKCATGHEVSNQESEKQSFPYTTQNRLAFGKLVATYNFAASPFLHYTVSN